MAKKIKETPDLEGEDAVKFLLETFYPDVNSEEYKRRVKMLKDIKEKYLPDLFE